MLIPNHILMRDNFSSKDKDILAKRVAYRCSFLGCNIITIGPGLNNSNDIVNYGEAAHICAASQNGPRFDETMSKKERSTIDNGIWMCRNHARMIDADCHNYSVNTLKQWKVIAEKRASEELKSMQKKNELIPTTFISLGNKIIFEGVWNSAINNIWEFQIKNFVLGNIDNIKNFNDEITSNYLRYIIIESQGDGREIDGDLNWTIVDGEYYISLKTKEKSKRITPYNMKGISMNFEIENGSLKIIKGEEYAKQIILSVLSAGFGEFKHAPTLCSFSSSYYWKYKQNIELFERLLKLEIIRLISIPYFNPLSEIETPPLNFINRILNIEIDNTNLINNKLPFRLRLEWGDGKIWEDMIEIYFPEI